MHHCDRLAVGDAQESLGSFPRVLTKRRAEDVLETRPRLRTSRFHAGNDLARYERFLVHVSESRHARSGRNAIEGVDVRLLEETEAFVEGMEVQLL